MPMMPGMLPNIAQMPGMPDMTAIQAVTSVAAAPVQKQDSFPEEQIRVVTEEEDQDYKDQKQIVEQVVEEKEDCHHSH